MYMATVTVQGENGTPSMYHTNNRAHIPVITLAEVTE